ncbi:hypothetical protein LINPERPRIM_LOCUS38332 [Linum perenne]
MFKAELFEKPLDGSTLGECYSAVAAIANRWLNLLGFLTDVMQNNDTIGTLAGGRYNNRDVMATVIIGGTGV